jgi:hypothetical protein
MRTRTHAWPIVPHSPILSVDLHTEDRAMDNDELRQWASIQNARKFLRLPGRQTPRLSIRLAKLEKVDAEIAALKDTQSRESNDGDTRTAKMLRVALRKHHLRVICRDAKLYLQGEPGVKDMFRMPHERTADSKLVDAARRIVDNAKPFKATFIDEAGLRTDFIARAETAIDALEAHMKQPDTAANRRSRARASLPDALREGRRILDSIDGIIDDEFADDKSTRDLWKRARRLPGKIGRPKNTWRPPPKPLPPPPEPPPDE